MPLIAASLVNSVALFAKRTSWLQQASSDQLTVEHASIQQSHLIRRATPSPFSVCSLRSLTDAVWSRRSTRLDLGPVHHFREEDERCSGQNKQADVCCDCAYASPGPFGWQQPRKFCRHYEHRGPTRHRSARNEGSNKRSVSERWSQLVGAAHSPQCEHAG